MSDLLDGRERLQQAGERLVRAIKGLDSYAALGGAPVQRTDEADAAIEEWELAVVATDPAVRRRLERWWRDVVSQPGGVDR